LGLLAGGRLESLKDHGITIDGYEDTLQVERSGRGSKGMQEGPPTPGSPDEEALRLKAEKRVKEKMGLATHVGVYLIINIFLVIIWSLTGAGYPWFLWVIVGWGVGLALHAFGYFVGLKGETRKEHMVAKEMDRLRREQGNRE
jgi:hypothetical protein